MVQIDFINVGYGDSILLQFDSGKGNVFRVLIDCGDYCVRRNSPESRRISAADFLVKNGIDAIDLLILSHLHLDHVGGLKEIACNIQVKELLSNYLPPKEFWGHKIQINSGFSSGSQNLQKSLDILSAALPLLSAEGCIIREIRDNERITIPGYNAEMSLSLSDSGIYALQKQIFDKALAGKADDNDLHRLDLFINNTSIRVYAEIGNKRILLPGDVYAAEWSRYDVPACDILKVPHHGHKDGLNDKILQKAGPEHVVISVSNDREDDCPSREITDLIRSGKANLYFTDAVKEQDEIPAYQESVRFRIRDMQIESDPE